MRKPIVPKLLFISVASLIIYSCKDNNNLAKNPAIPDQSFVEEFDTATAAVARGWQFVNNSDPKGSGVWQDGGSIPPHFNAYSNKGRKAGFIGADYLSTSAEKGTISNWLISPSLTMQNGDRIIFYTRAWQAFDGVSDTTDFGNSRQLRMNPLNDSADVGTASGNGSFSKILLYINPDLVYSSVLHPAVFAYPSQWTRFIVTVTGLNAPLKSRFGFRYYVTDGGSNGNASGIGIDSVAYKSTGH
jgi:hypothetical protein